MDFPLNKQEIKLCKQHLNMKRRTKIIKTQELTCLFGSHGKGRMLSCFLGWTIPRRPLQPL